MEKEDRKLELLLALFHLFRKTKKPVSIEELLALEESRLRKLNRSIRGSKNPHRAYLSKFASIDYVEFVIQKGVSEKLVIVSMSNGKERFRPSAKALNRLVGYFEQKVSEADTQVGTVMDLMRTFDKR